MACVDTQIFLGFFSTASPEWLRTCPEGMSGDSGHLADPPELPWSVVSWSKLAFSVGYTGYVIEV